MRKITLHKITLKQAISLILFIFILPVSVQSQEPGVVWANKLTGNFAWGGGSVTDTSGNTYVTGAFSGTVNFGDTTLTAMGDTDVFVVKTNAFGTVLWAERFGGPIEDLAGRITVDAAGNVYTIGSFRSIATFGSVTLITPSTHRGLFVVKQNSSGTVLWATQFSSPWTLPNGDFMATGITVDSQGNVYTTGRFISNTAVFGDITLNHISEGFNSPHDTFVVKQDTSGQVLWAKNFGAVEETNDTDVYVRSYKITTDFSDNLYITGHFGNTANFDNIALTGASYTGSAFLTKMSPSGNVVWAKRFGEAGNAFVATGYDVATDTAGNVYVTGNFAGEMNVGTATLTSYYNTDYEMYLGNAFVLKTDSSGEGLWGEVFSTEELSGATGVSISTDASGNMYVTGHFDGTIDVGGIALIGAGQGDVFVSKINSSGIVEWADRFGSIDNDTANSITVDAAGNMYVAGMFKGTVAFGNTTLTGSGTLGEIFLMRISPDGTMATAQNQPQAFRVYPNPVKDWITIELPDSSSTEVTVEVFNLLGQKVMEATSFYGTKTLDLSEITEGVYLLKINNNIVKIKKQ